MTGLRQVSWKEFEKFLIKIGCVFVREKGDHRVWKRRGLRRPIVLPRVDPPPIFVVRNNLRLLDVSVEEYLEAVRKH